MSTMPPSRSATHPSMLPPTLPTHGRARGVVFLHAVPRALCPHVEWALSAIVDTEIRLDWQPQPVSPPLLRAELPWAGRPGLGSRFMSALKGFPDLVAEVTEDPSPGREGERYALTPTSACTARSSAYTATSWCPRIACVPRLRGLRRQVPNSRTASPISWARRGTPNSSPIARRGRTPPCACSTTWSDRVG